MKKALRYQLSVFSALLLVSASAYAAPASQPWRVRAHVTVRTPVVRLGELVAPSSAMPAPLAAYTLAAAPQPGIALRWSRAQFSARLRSAGIATSQFEIPLQIEVQRASQPIPVALVLEAVGVALHRPLLEADINFTAPLTTATAPAVHVLRAVPDRLHGRIEVFCRAEHDPLLLPFLVSVRMSAAERAQHAQSVWPLHAPPAKPILVRPGRTAQLTIAAPGFALTTRVQPLQPGRQGDHIRVRSLATKAILQVLVTGRDQVSSLTQGERHVIR